MEKINLFLDASSINGLSHISNAKRYLTKLFWTLTVMLGFSVATILIYESFQDWSKNPVKTTISSIPITEVKFPKLTVCPPKNTFTDLNYDLMLAEKFEFSEDKREEIYKYVKEIIDENFYMEEWNKLHEDNRFYNWYQGYTHILEPDPTKLSMDRLLYIIETSATSGAVTTQHFGEEFQPDLVVGALSYQVHVHVPTSIRNNESIALKVNFEKVSFPETEASTELYIMNNENIVRDQSVVHKSYNPPGQPPSISILDGGGGKDGDAWIYLQRIYPLNTINKLTMKWMPGFKFSWSYVEVEDQKELNRSKHKNKAYITADKIETFINNSSHFDSTTHREFVRKVE